MPWRHLYNRQPHQFILGGILLKLLVMAQLFIKELLCISVLWVVYTQIKVWLKWRSLKKWGEQYGCGEVTEEKNKLPGGLERYSVLFTGLKGDLISFHLFLSTKTF